MISRIYSSKEETNCRLTVFSNEGALADQRYKCMESSNLKKFFKKHQNLEAFGFKMSRNDDFTSIGSSVERLCNVIIQKSFNVKSRNLFFGNVDQNDMPTIRQEIPCNINRVLRLRKVKGAHIKSLDQQFVDAYEEIGANKVAFNFVCKHFRKKSLRGWGFMEFQYVAMEYMKAFNVHRDTDAYNQLLNMYPRGPLRQTTVFAEAFQLG